MAEARFSRIVMVDWSAADGPSAARPVKDAIHAGLADADGCETFYFRTRADCMGWVAGLARKTIAEGGRMLAGFDFAFGYPVGAAFALAGRPDALALWRRLSEVIEDDAGSNRSNRFDAAAALNDAFPGEGPFWGHPQGRRYDGLSPKKGPGHPDHPPELRLCETHARTMPGADGQAQPVWKLAYPGSVGSQALLGVKALEGLRQAPGLAGSVAVWPFEGGFVQPDAPVTLAEIFPSLWASAIEAARGPEEIRDVAQVRFLAERFSALDRAGALEGLFARPAGLSEAEAWIAAREEGWILGIE
ncbi:hypothetical protein ACQ5SO_01295 [Rhodovulum sp. DZ06]|uniref:hypothetical protein n=1 Tax=Rhodovulum sp. DZ06 TaxID=3425126 RepID=UPI003D33AADD